MPYPERVETDRLVLRRLRPDDAGAYEEIWSHPDVWAALGAGEEPDPRAAAATSLERQLRHWESHGFGLWAVTPAGSDRASGWIGAWYPDFVPELRGEIEIGWTLRHDLWGQGFATEGARAAIDTAFTHLHPARLISLIAATNTRSAAVAARLGMRHAGTTTTDGGMELGVYELPRPAEPAGN